MLIMCMCGTKRPYIIIYIHKKKKNKKTLKEVVYIDLY